LNEEKFGFFRLVFAVVKLLSKFGIVDDWTISAPVPMSILFGN